jgi:hypothetical protein
MAVVQVSGVNKDFPLILTGEALIIDTQTILQIAGRTVPLYNGTVMSQIASTEKWVPWLQANLAGTTGIQYPWGILVSGDVTAAALAAGDVTGVAILVGGAGVQVDLSLMVFDQGDSGGGTLPTLAMIPTVPTNLALTARSILNMKGIFPTTTLAFDNTEN